MNDAPQREPQKEPQKEQSKLAILHELLAQRKKDREEMIARRYHPGEAIETPQARFERIMETPSAWTR